MDATRALAETDRALARYRRRLAAVLRNTRSFAATEAEYTALGRDSRSFGTAAGRLARALPPSERTTLGRLRTARSGAKLWHGLIAAQAEAMRAVLDGPLRDDSVVPDFVAQARLRRRFTRAAMVRDARLKALAGALKGLRRRPGRGGPETPDAPSHSPDSPASAGPESPPE